MKRYVHANTGWIDNKDMYYDEDFDATGEEFEDFWQEYLGEPEDKVNKELKIFLEPSVRGSLGAMFIFDESGEGRFEPAEIDWYEWCENELEMALKANSEKEYENLYRNYVKEVCGI